MMPNLYIIAGCNGAGKTTSAFNVLPRYFNCENFLNADEIARGLSPFAPEKASIEAGRIMLLQIQLFLNEKRDFAIETTLATKSYKKLIGAAHKSGYHAHLFFFWLDSVEVAKERVRMRVASGGHNIPENDIVRRYHRGIKNLKEIYIPVADDAVLFDHSNGEQKVIETYQKGELKQKVFADSVLNNIVKEPEESYSFEFLSMLEEALSYSFRKLLLEKKRNNEKLVVRRDGEIVFLDPEDFPQYQEAVCLRAEGKL